MVQGLFKSPNIGGHRGCVMMSVSKEMVPQYLRSNQGVGVGCSSANWALSTNYTLPLFLNNKRIFIFAMVSCSFHSWSLRKELECLVYEQPNEVKEVEVLIEFYSLTLKEVEDNLSIETCIVYEDEGELCFFHINPKKVLKFTSQAYIGTVISHKPHVQVTLTRGISSHYKKSFISRRKF
nr:disease resistance protein TAO1-like [Ipomoea batatas]GMC94099.1 disease resistance protein TAO1-like [Ipomoea batatas]